MAEYAELHAHSNYSFQEGASSVDELAIRAQELGYRALALTEHDNLCGAMAFAQVSHALGFQSITGAEVTLKGGGHLTLLARTPQGYSNLSRLLSFAHVFGDRRHPELDPALLLDHTQGLIVLTGCAQGPIPQALMAGRLDEAKALARQYKDWFGKDNCFLELQQNLVHGDTLRIRRLAELGQEMDISLVATNNVHYHLQQRHRLQDCLVAMRHNRNLEETHRERRANSEFYLKSPSEMARLFQDLPSAISNTLVIAERCTFDLTKDLTYRFPDYPVPEGFTPFTYLEDLCRKAAVRRYGAIDQRVDDRLQQELRLIDKHNLAGFLLIYHEIIQIAREVQVDLGLVDREIPIEETPPGRGRGSSVAMLVGYLTGLSHIDPLQYDLRLDRFLPDEAMATVPDIDLDFPRNIREELIKRVHAKWGWDHAALSGMIVTYQAKSAIRDLGKVLSLPFDEVDNLAKRIEHAGAGDIRSEMLAFPDFRHRVDAPGWSDLINLSAQLDGFPKYLAQHPGGMIISSTPLIDQVPIQQSAIDGRYVCHWDKDSIDDAGFVKIDFLSLGALSQMQEATALIEQRTGKPCDLSRIDFEDPLVYDMLGRADTIGIFQVESAAQMQTITRIKPRNLTDMAHEVAAVRPGVGANDGVSRYIRRRSGFEGVAFDHILEKRALERTLGVILFQDQINHVAMDVGGLSAVEADQMRRAFTKRNNGTLIKHYWQQFLQGATAKGVSPEVAERIFHKFNGHYMFPESHAFAFGVTAYQASWLKCYYPLEFFIGLFNEQPMGYYNLETLKEDAKRHNVQVLHPDINGSAEKCVIEDEGIRLGLLHVKGLGPSGVDAVVRKRNTDGPYRSIAEFMERTGLEHQALDNLADAGAFDQVKENRRDIRWEVGLRYRPVGTQMAFRLPVSQDMTDLPEQSAWNRMEQEYRTLGLYPEGHVMVHLRSQLPGVRTSLDMPGLGDGTEVWTAGLVVRRQRPLGKAVFITLEDEHGHIPLIVFPGVYERYRMLFGQAFLLVKGVVSRREGTMNIQVAHVDSMPSLDSAPRGKSWG